MEIEKYVRVEQHMMKAIIVDNRELKSLADHRLELLREGLEATKLADGHWSDRVRWITWVGKVEKELEEENK